MLTVQKHRIVFADGQSRNAFQPSLSVLADGRGLLTMQPIFGGDFYGDVEFSLTEGAFSGSAVWAPAEPIPALVKRASALAGVQEVVVDVRTLRLPDGRILAVGGNSFYTERGCAFWDKSIDRAKLPKQRAVYTIYTPGQGWSPREVIGAEDIGEGGDLRIACAQLALTEEGSVVLPCYYGTPEIIDCSGYPWPRQAVKTALAKVSGNKLKIQSYGNSLHKAAGRGFVEPSVAKCGGLWYMTLRAEDGCAYVTTSKDALHWEEPRAWCWENGEIMATDTTQQHFFSLDGELFLAYTRQTADNGDVPRWRAPLFAAPVDGKTLRLKKAAETVVFPLERRNGIPNMQGNFHCLDWQPNKAVIVDGALYITPAVGTTPARYQSALEWAEITR